VTNTRCCRSASGICHTVTATCHYSGM